MLDMFETHLFERKNIFDPISIIIVEPPSVFLPRFVLRCAIATSMLELRFCPMILD
jgi:hypothetical protein